MATRYLGRRVGSQATLSNAAMLGELTLASSVSPPANESGPMESTLHRMSSLARLVAGSNSLGFPLGVCASPCDHMTTKYRKCDRKSTQGHAAPLQMWAQW